MHFEEVPGRPYAPGPCSRKTASISDAAAAENTEKSSGDLIPNEIAIAVPNSTSSTVLLSATQRGQIPASSAIPKNNSAAVAAQARKGIVYDGRNEFTSAV